MKLWSEIVQPHGSSKETIVFLHGTGSNSRMWKNQVEFFSGHGYPCLSIDLRGHGHTHEPYEITSLQTHLNDLEQTLQGNLISSPMYFVGHSLGSIISIYFANKHPEQVKAIFAAALPGKVFPPLNKAFRSFVGGPMKVLKESEIKQYLGWRERTLIEMPVFTLEQISAQFADIDLLKTLPVVDCPVHLACGRFDPIALYWHVKEMKKKLPVSTMTMFEWGGHNFMDANPKSFNEWIAAKL